MSEILPNLFLGGLPDAKRASRSLEPRKITHVLNVAAEIVPAKIKPEIAHLFKEYHTLGVEDDDPTGDITPILDPAVEWIDETLAGGGTVLVHCMAGISRSACVVMAYLVAKKGYTLTKAFHFVVFRRDCVQPFGRFLQQLKVWCKQFGLDEWECWIFFWPDRTTKCPVKVKDVNKDKTWMAFANMFWHWTSSWIPHCKVKLKRIPHCKVF